MTEAGKLEAMIDYRIKVLSDLIHAEMNSVAKALDLQAHEYERRLLALNHEHDMMAQMKDVYVRGEVYKADMDRLYSERRESLKEAAESRRRQDEQTSANRRNTLVAVVAVCTALIGWGISLLLHYL